MEPSNFPKKNAPARTTQADSKANPQTVSKDETVEDTLEDVADLHTDREGNAREVADEDKPFWKCLGPGLITGAADDDPSGIGTYSVAGAQFGYLLLWLVPFCIPLMIAVQEMCARIGLVTGKGLAAVIKDHYPKWVLWGSVALLFGANTMNVWADLNVMAASLQMLFKQTLTLWLVVITVLCVTLQILVPYRYYVRVLKWLCLALLAYVVTAFWPSVHHNWGAIARNLFTPHLSRDPEFIMTVVGFLGTTISPYLFFWQAGETVEDEVAAGKEDAPGERTSEASDIEIRQVHADTVTGMLASQVITFFILITTKATLHDKGLTNIETAQDAAKALLPLGKAAYWLFTLGIIGTGLLAIPTLAGSAAYALAETAGWRYGLYRRFRRARGFYLTIAAVIIIGFLMNFVKSISPIKALLYSAVLNGMIAPVLIVLLLLICNNARIVGKRTNSRLSNLLGWFTVVLMSAGALYMIYAMLTGKAS